jgi:HEAT repeat protein
VSVLAAAPAPAQGGRIELPDPAPAPQGEPEPSEQEPEIGAQEQDPLPEFWADASSPAEKLFAAFEMTEDESVEVRQQFLEDLRALGLGTEVAAVRALGSPYAPSVLLAAELLEWVGDPEQDGQDVVRELVVAASRVPSVPAVSACLETARRLNQGFLPAVAVKLLGHPRRQVRTVGESRLARDPHPSHVPSLLQFLRFGRDQDVRLRAARLLEDHVAQEEVRDALRETLAGEDLEVVFVALDAMSGDGQPVDVGFLREQAEQAGSLTEAAYLLHALLRLQQTAGSTPLFDAGQLPLIRRLCDDRDLYVSGVGAACMAEFLFRSDYEEDMERWNALLPALLVRAVGGAEFFPQYARFLPIAENALRRITGEDFPDEARAAWLTWYEREADGFRLVRGSLALTPETLPELRVAWSRGEGVARVLLGPQAAWQPDDHILGGNGLEAVREALEAAGVLDATMLPGSYGPSTEPISARLEIALGGRRKLLSFSGVALPAWFDALYAELDAAWIATRWQDLAAAGALRPDPILQRLDAFEDAEGTGRAAALVDITRGHLGLLDDAGLASWCQELREAPGRKEAWDLALAAEFVEEAGRRAALVPELGLELLQLGLDGVADGPAATAMAMDLLVDLEEPQRSALLTATLHQLGLEAAVVASTDERLAVRIAGVRALGSLGEAALPTLLTALDDDHPLVVRAALRSVGELADPGALDAVLRYAQVGMPLDLHREALWAVGRIGATSAVPAVEASAVQADNAAVRIAALEALAAIDGPDVDAALARLFPVFAGGDLESSWTRAAGQRGGAALRATLEDYLLDEDPRIARQAAILGGALGSPAAAPALIEMLDTMPRDPSVLEALAMTLAVDFRSMPDPAGTYRQWWSQYGELGPAAWLRRAAEDSGHTLDERFAEASGAPRRATVETLYAIVVTGAPAQRGLAAYYLHAMTGVDSRPVLLGTPTLELSRRVAPWREWLDEA